MPSTRRPKHLFINGHSFSVSLHDEPDVRYIRGTKREDAHVFQEFHAATIAEVERRLGTFRAQHVSLGTNSLFPNTVIRFRLALPRGPLKTEFWNFRTYERDAPELIVSGARGARGRNAQGAASIVEQDDQDNWIQVTRSGLSPKARKLLSDLSMGLGHASTSDPEIVGLVADRSPAENNQRHFYARWQEFMNASSWADIHIDPITAKFEGTATMKG